MKYQGNQGFQDLPEYGDVYNRQAKGCLYGTATDPKRGTDDVMLTIAKLRNSKTSEKQEKAHFGRKSKSRSPWADTCLLYTSGIDKEHAENIMARANIDRLKGIIKDDSFARMIDEELGEV